MKIFITFIFSTLLTGYVCAQEFNSNINPDSLPQTVEKYNDEDIKVLWETIATGEKTPDQLPKVQQEIFLILYTKEFATFASNLFRKYQENDNRQKRFEFLWDKNYWFQKNNESMQKHKYYREMFCGWIQASISEKPYLPGTIEYEFATNLADYIDCDVLMTELKYTNPKLLEKNKKFVKKNQEQKDKNMEDLKKSIEKAQKKN